MPILLKHLHIVDIDLDTTGDILIENGKIQKIAACIPCENAEVHECKGLTAIPGLFDMHVHFRDPGQTHKEDILTGCKAALAGGVTGVLCMPNTTPPADNPDIIRYMIEKAKNSGVDLYPVGCITQKMSGGGLTNFHELKKAGARALSDDGRPVQSAEEMRLALAKSKEEDILIVSHCEDLAIINGGIMHKGSVSEELGVPGMDRVSEDYITVREILLAQSVNARIHICHVSSKTSVDWIRAAKQMGCQVTCETAPHYFMFTHERLRSRNANDRMNPPLREESDRLAIIEGLLDGTIDCIVTDHAPHTAEEKNDFCTAPNGIVGLETSLAATLTAFYHTGKATLSQIIAWQCKIPRKLLGLQEPCIQEGSRANLALLDLEKQWLVEPEKLHSKSHNTTFRGETLKGQVMMTINDGVIRFQR